jgi:hypothetical protein
MPATDFSTMPASVKIIDKLRERRQIEADLRHMLNASSELAFQQRARHIAAQGSQVLPAIIGALDQADTRMLKALGTVATFLDREEAVAALHQAARQPGRTDRGRLGAMTILSQFLGEPPDETLLAHLSDPEAVALASLQEILTEAEHDPAVLAEYAQDLDQQEPDLVLGVVQALSNSGDRRAVELLRVVAQDVRAEIASAALQALGAIRTTEAARSLQTLIPAAAPELRPVAERLLRKLRFSGVSIHPLPPADPGWRALIGPVDGLGQQSIWFLQGSAPSEPIRFLNVLLTDQFGAVKAAAHEQVRPSALPPRRPAGHLHDVVLPDGSGAILMLEAPFDLGRRLVRDALAFNRGTQIPLAGILRLRGPWLWGYAGAGILPQQQLPDLEEGDVTLVAESEALLLHPGFGTWTMRSEAIMQAAIDSVRSPRRDITYWGTRLAAELFADPEVTQMFSRRLVTMSEWLLRSGDLVLSRQALAVAQALGHVKPQDIPFVRALVRRDVTLAILSLHRKYEQASKNRDK